MRFGWVLAASFALVVCTAGCRRERDEEGASKKHTDPAVVTHTAGGETIIRIAPPVQERIGLRTALIEQASLAPELIAYGRLEEDPSHSFTVRSPVAGTLQVAAQSPWPSIGQTIASGSVIGTVQPRIAPTDRVTLTNQLATARSEVNFRQQRRSKPHVPLTNEHGF